MTNVFIKTYRFEREKEIVGGLQSAMEKIGALVERQAKINTMHPLPSGKQHPERSDTTRLASSIIHWVEHNGNEISANIASSGKEGVYYGKYLEFGTVNHPPYPWLFPAVESNREKIISILKGSAKEKVREGMTWKKFTAGKMGEYMKTEGGHAGAMKRLGKEWQEYKAGKK